MVNKVSFYTARTDLLGIDFLFFTPNNVLVDTQPGTLQDGIWYSDVLNFDPGDYTVIVRNSEIVFGKEEIFWDGTTIVPIKEEIAHSVREELTVELAHIISLQNGLTDEQGILLLELYNLMGLDPTKPLVVTQTARTAGTISQSIVTTSEQTTVTRQ